MFFVECGMFFVECEMFFVECGMFFCGVCNVCSAFASPEEFCRPTATQTLEDISLEIHFSIIKYDQLIAYYPLPLAC